MKKNALLLLAMLVLAAAFQTKTVYASSCGYERFKDSESEIYLEYFPIVPYDPLYPTASEEFAIKFHIWQNSYWVVPLLCKRFPRGFEIKVYYRDDSCGNSNYVTWKEWYPTSTSQYGWNIMWTLSGGYGPLELSTTLSGPEVFGYERNYDEYDQSYGGKTYLHVGDLSSTYRSSYLWGPIDVYGGGSIGIPNDSAQSHQGHHVLIWVHVSLRWLDYDWWGHYEYNRDYDFVLGDDVPTDTDCWVTVQQGNTEFRDPRLTISASSGGSTSPAPGTYTYDYGSSATVAAYPSSGWHFDFWTLDGTPKYSNPITITMDSDHTLTAYFGIDGGGGGGEGCPALFVWNGDNYVNYGVIDIHNPSGEDVVREVPIQTEDVYVNNYKAKFRLREGWEGLNFSESVIDQVKLYAIGNDGNHYLCPLIKAEHSSSGNVLLQLLRSDEWKVQMLLSETTDLTFTIPYQNIQGYTFVIEGCNQNKW